MATDFETEGGAGGAASELALPIATRAPGEPLTAGFVALVDSAPLIIASHLGFARAEGLDLRLVRESSWANIRDKLALGHFDAAHMLAPMTIAATLGMGPLETPLVVPFVLNWNGNALVLASAVHRQMEMIAGQPGLAPPLDTARSLARVVQARKAAGEPMLTLAMTYPFSSHNYELRYWLAAGGIDPDQDVRLVVVPPPLMADALAAGHIDGFCVGAPWPSVTVDAGLGSIVAASSVMKPGSPEKVIGVREVWAARHPDRLDALVRALDAAARWCEDPAHADDLAAILARSEHVNAPATLIRRALQHRLVVNPGMEAVALPNYIRFSGAGANRPAPADAIWFATQMRRWGQVANLAPALDAARATFRPELYDRALGLVPSDGRVGPVVPLFDGVAFDPEAPDAYLAALGVA